MLFALESELAPDTDVEPLTLACVVLLPRDWLLVWDGECVAAVEVFTVLVLDAKVVVELDEVLLDVFDDAVLLAFPLV